MKTSKTETATLVAPRRPLVSGAKITDAMPTGHGAIVSGSHVAIGIKEVININIGSGVVNSLTDYSLSASGSYNFNVLGYQGSGTWSISLDSNDNGQTYQVHIKFSGTYSGDQQFTANASESGSGTDTTITYSGGGQTVVQTYQNDGIFQKAKVWFNTNVNGHDVNLYVYNSDVYGLDL